MNIQDFPYIVEPDSFEPFTGFASPYGAEFEKESIISARYSGLISSRTNKKASDSKLIIFVIGGLSH